MTDAGEVWRDLGANLALGNSQDQAEFFAGFCEVILAEDWGEVQLASLAYGLVESGEAKDIRAVLVSFISYLKE